MWAWLLIIAGTIVFLIQWRGSDISLRDYVGLFVVRAYARLWHGCLFNTPTLPEKGAALLVANHTSSADPALLSSAFRRPLCFVIAQEYYKLRLLGRLFAYAAYVPVRRNGRDACSIRRCLRRLSEGRILCIFPEGGLSNAGRGRPGHAKAGVALLALRSRVPVFPARITGGPQTAHLGRAWMRPSRARITFGSPVDLSAYYDRPINRKLLEEVTTVVMKHVAELRPPTLNGRGGRHDCCNRQRTDPETLPAL
jgi:1-acyl-sn-glycerol-3-phosphate acyltransferase